MKQTKLSDIIEKNVDDKLYLKKKDFEKRKYLKISLYRNYTINGDIVTINKSLLSEIISLFLTTKQSLFIAS